MIVCLTGTPGAGKTTLAKKISRDFKFKYLDGNKIIEKYKLSEGFDKAKKCKIVDVKKFSNAIIQETNKPGNYVIDSHLSHHINSKIIDLCIVCRCNLKILEKRLKKRKYSKSKIRENLDAEIFEVCLNEAIENKHNIVIFNKNYNDIKKKITHLK